MTERRTALRDPRALARSTATGAGTAAFAPAGRQRGPFSVDVRLRWLGVSGWEIVFGRGHRRRSILFDPYLSRMPFTNAEGSTEPGIPLRLDHEAVETVATRHLIGAPELILVSHGHFDHMADVPQLLARPAWRRSRIRVLCHETVSHLIAAMGAPARRLADAVLVKGGECLQFDGYTVEVFRSLHSRRPDHGYFAPGHRLAPPPRPSTLGDFVEGGTLAYQVSVEGGPSVLLMGASDVAEREMAGIRPDVAAVPMTTTSAVHRYPGRLLDITGHPPLLIPCHHDDMVTPLTASPRLLAASSADSAVRELTAAAGPGSRVVAPRHLDAMDLAAALA
ncbi:MBL fold metallo-hydrolase [Streptomyces sp. NPDC048717]|uniref:MBL fold metallo-hydrolase n=1 Tax=Streptomyces sp. NPDC048717 TaxID=3154928 RepID=UPI0034347492